MGNGKHIENNGEKACRIAGVDPNEVVCTIEWRVADFMDALLRQDGMTIERAASIIGRFTSDDGMPSYPRSLKDAQVGMGLESLDTLAFEAAGEDD